MGSVGLLWHRAWEKLPTKYQDALPISSVGSPADLIRDLEAQIVRSKGKPVTLPNSSTFFVRDVLEKISHWAKKFVEVGDTVIQYDPGHAALPWAALRLLLQMAINNVEKHAAILEGIDTVSRWLVWAKIQESTVDTHFQEFPDLKPSFEQLYEQILTLIARSLRFLQKRRADRVLQSFLSTDSKFRKNIDDVSNTQATIKDLISGITATKNLQQSETILVNTRLLLSLAQPISRLESSGEASHSILSSLERRNILDWTSQIPYEMHHRDLSRKALADTGGWLFRDPTYFNWQNSSSSEILWLHGGPGFGKSTLLSMVISSLASSHLSSGTPYPIYFYCSRSTSEPERSDASQIFRSLVRQASDLPGGPPLNPVLRERYEKRRISGEVSAEEAPELLVEAFGGKALTYVLIDALDECGRESREVLIEGLERVLRESTSLVKIFVTSRENYSDIEIAMGGGRYPDLRIEAGRNGGDIERYVRTTVGRAVERRKILPNERVGEELRERIVEELCRGAEGMFRWVELQMEYLYTIKFRSVLIERLGKLPPGLERSYEELYDLKMSELGEEQGEIVKRMLTWLLISQRPLWTDEFMRLTLGKDACDVTDETVLDACFNLVSVDLELDRFRFSHPSVREFLEKKQEFRPLDMHDLAVRSCLDFLTEERHYHRRHYAAVYWPAHAKLACDCGPSLQVRKLFLCQPCAAFDEWARIVQGPKSWNPLVNMTKTESLLRTCLHQYSLARFVCVTFGLTEELREMIERHGFAKTEVNHKGDGQLLERASKSGHAGVVELLIDKGADVDRLGSTSSPLLEASRRGHEEIVGLLLGAGANVNAYSSFRDTNALQCASAKGRIGIVRLLLDAGADVHAGNALRAACETGHMDVVELLLDAGADVNAHGGEALSAAAKRGNRSLVQMLLDAGAHVNNDNNALRDAVDFNHLEVARLLVEAGADVNAKTKRSPRSALENAAHWNRVKMVKLLLNAGADVNVMVEDDHRVTSILFKACRDGYVELMQLLLEAGAEIDAKVEDEDVYSNALCAASEEGNLNAVKVLLDAGADVNMKFQRDVVCPLYAACGCGQYEVVKHLLSVGADVNASGGQYGSPLGAASRHGFFMIVELLLDAGADVNAQGGSYGNALLAALQFDHTGVVELLRSKGAVE